MRKVTVTFGLIAGAILSVFMTVFWMIWADNVIDFDSGEIMGYGSMIVALSMVFFGIKSYRDHYLSGRITFVKGLQIGLLITAIASVMYAGTWEVLAQAQPERMEDFIRQYTEYTIQKSRDSGATDAELEEELASIQSFQEMYENPMIRFGISLTEILPVGILITLISAAILRRKEILPAEPTATG